MLVIRLSRRGRKKRPTYRLVLQERDWAPKSKAIESLGSYNPHTDPATVEFDAERIQYWIGQGAQTSPTVHNMLVTAGIVQGDKRRVVFGKKTKSEEEIKAEEEAAKKAAESKEEKVEEASSEETPAEPSAEEKPKETPEEKVEEVVEASEEKPAATEEKAE